MGKENRPSSRRLVCTTSWKGAKRHPSSSLPPTSDRLGSSYARPRAWWSNEDLSSRIQVFKNELRVPERGASFVCLPAEPKRLEGLSFSTAILDEIGAVSRDTHEVLTLAQGKRETSTLIGIGTPGPDPHNNVLADLRQYAAEHPDDPTFVHH